MANSRRERFNLENAAKRRYRRPQFQRMDKPTLICWLAQVNAPRRSTTPRRSPRGVVELAQIECLARHLLFVWIVNQRLHHFGVAFNGQHNGAFFNTVTA